MAGPITEFYIDTNELISTTETVYIIGDDNCQFNTIVRILEPEKSLNMDNKLIDIAIDLDIPGGTIAHWRRGINFGNLSNDVLLYELLKEFRSKYASEATISKFIDALCKKGLFQEAEHLGAHFGIDLKFDKTFVQTQTNQDKLAKIGCGASTLIIIIIIGFTCLVPYLLKDFLGCPVSSMIEEEIYNTTTQWAKNIENNNGSGIYNILLRCEFSNKTSLLLSNSVDAAYNSNLTNFPAILKFVQGIFSPMYRYKGYSALLAAMQKNEHDYTSEMLKLVYFIKNAMADENDGAELHEKYATLTKLVVEEIRAIIFGQYVVIYNTHFSEYIYLTDDPSPNSKLAVMTTPGELLQDFTNLYWVFEAYYENDKLFFRIQTYHDKNKISICPDSESFENQNRKTVECYSNDNAGLWVVTPTNFDLYNAYFNIKRPDGCLLYSPKSFHSRNIHQYALTWERDCNDVSSIPGSYSWVIKKN